MGELDLCWPQVTARDISYVECHATATEIGDAIELRGLADGE